MSIPSILLVSVLGTVVAHSHAAADEIRPATAQVAAKLEAVQKQQQSARKDIALSEGDIRIQQQQIAELERRIQEAKKRTTAAQEQLNKAKQREQAAAKSVAHLSAQLTQHKGPRGGGGVSLERQ